MKAYVRHGSARLFHSAFLEAASRVRPATPFLFYIPLVVLMEGGALWSGQTSLPALLAFFPAGWLSWQLMEYGIHRYLFHWEGNGPWTRRLHEILHGYHHRYPDDEDRLVMPLGASLPLAGVIGGALWAFAPLFFGVPFFAGIVSGYLWYDFLHWSTHFRRPLTRWGRVLRAHHMAHHFASPEHNFGISHRWIDRLAGTLRSGSV